MAGPTTVRKSRSRRPLAQWSEPVVSRRKRWESSPPHPHCVHCTLEPLKLTMNVQNDHLPYKEHQRVGRRPYPDHPTYHSPHCDNCEYETRYRPRTVSAPAAHVIRYRDVACGSSEPMLSSGSNERRNTLGVVNELYPRTQVGETQYHSAGPSPDAEYPGANLTRSRRPTKVYIYPVHPQTPPGSRSPSPERLQRRRGTLGLEEMQEYEPRDRRRSREVEQQGGGMPGLSRFHNMVTGMTTGTAAQTEPPNTKQRHVWPEQPAGPDWVYRPLK
ncbi:hypothetical protein JD844_000789 [Phrynosoma platyrhinos]|uniref:Uncharacterized protein n=1 Tax=Phrynosoma platyrhinos TaxID=52577 RepID=A0ABQ7T8K7_PHRPL|nr:hypothetical protein JD844_000789 [Phrynosoma platyrhinos]